MSESISDAEIQAFLALGTDRAKMVLQFELMHPSKIALAIFALEKVLMLSSLPEAREPLCRNRHSLRIREQRPSDLCVPQDCRCRTASGPAPVTPK
jgi:hypothetical protein